jgi:Domain of unknown function (DUF4402)
MTGPGHILRVCVALLLIPLPLKASDDLCRLCTPSDNVSNAPDKREVPISIDITTQLDFSRAALFNRANGGAIEVDPNSGSRTVNGGLVDLGGSSLVGTAVVRGEPGRLVRIDLPNSVRMTSSAGGMIEVAGLRTNLTHMPQLDSTGRLSFSFGGRLIVRGDVSGTFRGRIPITAQYE